MSSQAEILSASVDPDGAVQFHLTCSGDNMCLTWTANGRWHLGGRGFLSIRDAAVILGHSDEWFLGLLAGRSCRHRLPRIGFLRRGKGTEIALLPAGNVIDGV